MAIKTVVAFVLGLAVASLAKAQQQPAGKVPQIGFLTTGSRATDAPRIEAFRQDLRELGYVEGKNINIEYGLCRGEI